jgi:hypothetical protein
MLFDFAGSMGFYNYLVKGLFSLSVIIDRLASMVY